MNLADVFGHGNRHVATTNKPRISKAHVASPSRQAPRLRCHRAAKPRKGIQPMDSGQLCPEVGFGGGMCGRRSQHAKI